MVNIGTIKQCNVRFATQRHSRLVGVFAGATSGIGASTLESMVQMTHQSTFYVIGRSTARFADQQARLKKLSPTCKLVFFQGEFTLLSNVDTFCKQIAAAEEKVDYLYMSPGIISGDVFVNGPTYTTEGLEECFAISYYSRMRLVSNLLPLLRHSECPRVLSVLNGGREARMNDDDLGLKKGWNPITVGSHTTTMTSLAFDHLATENEGISFMHSFPGIVKTGIISRLTAPESAGMLWRAGLAAFRGIGGVVMACFGMEAADCGERQAYLLTDDKHGTGSWRIGATSDTVTGRGALARYDQEGGWPERVWQHTQGAFSQTSEA